MDEKTCRICASENEEGTSRKLTIARNLTKLTPEEQVELVGKVVRIAVYDENHNITPLYITVGTLEYLILKRDVVRYQIKGFQAEGKYPTEGHYGLIQTEA